MAETLTGQAFVWGVANLTFTGVAISSATGRIQNYDFAREADVEELRDEDGETVGRAFFNHRKTINVTVVPSNSATVATAVTNMLAMLPAIGSQITAVDADGTDTLIEKIAASGNTTAIYQVMSARLNRTNRGMATIDLSLEAFEHHDVSNPTT